MHRYLRYLLFALLVLALPVAGVLLVGQHVGPYFQFPPRNSYIAHLPFFWPAFILMAIGIGFCFYVIGVMLLIAWLNHRRLPAPRKRPYPWWGWAGLAAGVVCWAVAWTPVPWLDWVRAHSFTPLWLAYILAVNALVLRRSGVSLMTHRTRYFLLLFPASAGFWWFFEYLNRFVQNWYYRGVLDYSPAGYFLEATLAFSTVLPAVLSTRDLLLTIPWFDRGFGRGVRWRLPWPRAIAVLSLALGCLSLVGIGAFPNLFFPMLWLGPLLTLLALETLAGKPHLFTHIREGDWRPVFGAMLAALVCGFFWELWNDRSAVKWIYEIPLVHRFELFEMPILGYAGYLPFGWESAAVGDLVERELVSHG